MLLRHNFPYKFRPGLELTQDLNLKTSVNKAVLRQVAYVYLSYLRISITRKQQNKQIT